MLPWTLSLNPLLSLCAGGGSEAQQTRLRVSLGEADPVGGLGQGCGGCRAGLRDGLLRRSGEDEGWGVLGKSRLSRGEEVGVMSMAAYERAKLLT